MDPRLPIKRLALWLFIFFPFTAYPQYLEPGDIAIFIKNIDTIQDAINGQGGYQTEREAEEWRAFNEQDMGLMRDFENIKDDLTLEQFKQSYNEFMNSRTPPSLQRTFYSIGWESGGFQKTFTILFGVMFMVIINETPGYGGPDLRLILRALETIDSSDRKIIEENMERIIELF
jgi:hypothetical protein